MNLDEFKKTYLRQELEISSEYGRIFSFIDFSNVNKWFQNDRQSWNDEELEKDERIDIDVEKLKEFCNNFSDRSRLYYGQNPEVSGSLAFTYVLRKIFGKRELVTKDIQKIKHYLEIKTGDQKPEHLKNDRTGKTYIEIHKCNFDIEIAVDAYKMIEHYDTFCIFSGDADFIYLHNYLKKKNKKVIIIKGGHITTKLRESADLVINAQKIKKYIAKITKTKT